jgi:outer membrane biosynthesis protein TonB
MSACYRLVLDSICRSNHHRLAVMALQHLANDDAQSWRNVFLKNRDMYLEGAKAPDEQFKDFKNHVLHVKDGDWGGAPQAAREWYRRTVRALKDGDWSHAAWCAGVMSHYVVDPVQPFHTGQTEEEGVIHRAAEWSFSKAFPELYAIIENELGWPDVPAAEGDDWLEKMVRAGALVSNQHYQTILDHYDFEVGRKDPVGGLDQQLKDVMAALLSYATVQLARVLDKAIAESQAEAPNVSLAVDTVAIALSQPVRAIAGAINDGAERKLVNAQYAEFRKTGKVRETLSDDDKTVRALHAEEVLKVSLSSLDCQWPKETGTAHGTGAQPRNAKKKPKAKAATAPKPVKAKVEKPAPAPKAEARKPEAKKVEEKPVAQKPVQKAAPAPKVETPPTAAPSNMMRVRLSRDASVVDAPSIGPKTAGRLHVIGVKTVGDLLGLAPEEAVSRIKASHINAQLIRDWQAQALLACSVPDLSALGAQLLVGAGVTSVEDLATAEPDFLLDAIGMFAASQDGERALRGQKVPDRTRIEAWIAAARSASTDRTAA